MPRARNKQLETRLILALSFGASIEQAALQSGVSESTVYRRLRDPAFTQKIAEMRADVLQRASAMMSASSLEACKTLVGLLQPTAPPTVRLGAARAILEIGVKVREEVDLTQRVAALERQFGPTPLKVVSS